MWLTSSSVILIWTPPSRFIICGSEEKLTETKSSMFKPKLLLRVWIANSGPPKAYAWLSLSIPWLGMLTYESLIIDVSFNLLWLLSIVNINIASDLPVESSLESTPNKAIFFIFSVLSYVLISS